MKTLKQLVMEQQFNGKEDSTLIAEWFAENDMAIEGIEILSKLAKKKIEDDQWKYGLILGDLSMYGATECFIKEFGVEDGLHLDTIIRQWIVSYRLNRNFEEDYPQQFEWLKDFIPKHKMPFVFWRDFVNRLNEKGIYFKDQDR